MICKALWHHLVTDANSTSSVMRKEQCFSSKGTLERLETIEHEEHFQSEKRMLHLKQISDIFSRWGRVSHSKRRDVGNYYAIFSAN